MVRAVGGLFLRINKADGLRLDRGKTIVRLNHPIFLFERGTKGAVDEAAMVGKDRVGKKRMTNQ